MKNFKKVISCVMVLIMLCATLVPAVAASAQTSAPIILVGGRGSRLVNASGQQIYPHQIDTKDYILENCKELLPELAKAIVTNDYEAYCDGVFECIASLYTEMVLDENGEVINGSRSPFTYSESSIKNALKKQNGSNIHNLQFLYDWRLDPMQIADELDAYIDTVIRCSGQSKVIIVGRCMGGNIVTAYLQRYGSEKLSKVLFYETTALGTTSCGIPFSGDYDIHSEGVARYISEALGTGETEELVRAMLELCNANYSLNLAGSAIMKIYEKVAPDIERRLLYNTYASYPSYWSMVDDAHYEKAKQLVFGGEEKYDKFIQKIDYYHYNVLLRASDILTRCADNGLEVYNVCKYGKQIVPLGSSYDELSDNVAELKFTSLGATCSKMCSTLSEDYIRQRVSEGKEKYISPDKQVDASTCLFPETTWFIKNIDHMNFSRSVDRMIFDIILFNESPTVDTLPGYSQFMVYSDETDSISIMTEENSKTETFLPDFFTSLKKVIKLLTAMLKNYLSTLSFPR